jgi:hypothetical protein
VKQRIDSEEVGERWPARAPTQGFGMDGGREFANVEPPVCEMLGDATGFLENIGARR